jgi:hypothetical protein
MLLAQKFQSICIKSLNDSVAAKIIWANCVGVALISCVS